MPTKLQPWLAASAVSLSASTAMAGTPPYFQPLTESAPVVEANSVEEMNAPWITPAGVAQDNLTSLNEVEGDHAQSVVRVPGLGSGASMFDMVSFDPSGRYLFVPHETQYGAGMSRYDLRKDEMVTLFAGDMGGAEDNWTNDYAAFDPSTYTPNGTVLLGEEWAGEGRIIEILNPHDAPNKIRHRELTSIANVAHEGLRFSLDSKTLYFVDEWNSGSIYKFVCKKTGDYMHGQTFVLSVDAFSGVPADLWNDESNAGTTRTGAATWIPITDEHGKALTVVDPFRNGPTNDPRESADTRGGRPAADEVGATPYGRPEDMEVGALSSGNEVLYFTATSEQSIYSVEMLDATHAMVRLAASEADTPKNVGFAATSAVINSPDNLAQDALGNIYVIEDAPNGSTEGGDIWFLRDVDSDGVAESMDHFLSIRVAGSEATGMIFNPKKPTQFVVSVQHPTTTDLELDPTGFGDALWLFDVQQAKAPQCGRGEGRNEIVQRLQGRSHKRR